jgi:hypothetical protein
MGRAAGAISYSDFEVVPVGDPLYNGLDQGGARNYPWSYSLAIAPPAEYSQNIGPGNSSIIIPPVSALEGTTGAPVGGGSAVGRNAAANPFSLHTSPLVWIILGLLGAVWVMHETHYKAKG